MQHALTTDGTSQCWPYVALWPDPGTRRSRTTGVITVYARTRAGTQRPTRRLPHSVKVRLALWPIYSAGRQWPLLNAAIVLTLRNLDQPVFGSRTSKGQKRIRIQILFFEVRIFELRLTSLVPITVSLSSMLYQTHCLLSIHAYMIVTCPWLGPRATHRRRPCLLE